MLTTHDQLCVVDDIHGEDERAHRCVAQSPPTHCLVPNSHPTAQHQDETKAHEDHNGTKQVRPHAREVVGGLASENGQGAHN